MNLNHTIENIRRKPEYIRARYVWGGVIVSMFFILLIWLISLQVMINPPSNVYKKNDAHEKGMDNTLSIGEMLEKTQMQGTIKDIPEEMFEEEGYFEETMDNHVNINEDSEDNGEKESSV